MRNGFIFKNKHSNDFGVTVQTQSRPIKPEMKVQTYDSPYIDGEYDFSTANAYNREFYKNRVFKMNLQIQAADLSELNNKIAKITTWLMGNGELIFDDIPNVKWNATVIETIDYKPENGGHKAVVAVSYKVQTWAALVFDIFDGPTLDNSNVRLDDEIPLSPSDYYTVKTVGDSTIYNTGDRPVRPVLRVKDVTKSVTITCNGVSITVLKNCVIDCDKQLVTDTNGNSIMNSITGSFFELETGANTINLSAAATVEFSFYPQYVWNTGIDEVYKWDK